MLHTMSLPHLDLLCLQVEQCRMPGLAIYLTLDAGKVANTGGLGGSSVCGGSEGGDVVSYVTGLLLSPNQPQRSWFAQFVKSGQRVSIFLSFSFTQSHVTYT